jgi:hypothetical protein
MLVLFSCCALALGACGSSSSSSGATPPQSSDALVRFADGTPNLETLVNGVPEGLGNAYLQFDSRTVASSFAYGTLTPFVVVPAGAHTLTARDTLGYAVGPLQIGTLAAGKQYTLVVVGTFPKYSVLMFAEPAAGGAQLSLYEASPTVTQSGFGSFRASQHSGFTQLGTATLGTVATVALGSGVTNFGGYAGSVTSHTGTYTPREINGFDKNNALPFHNAGRLSLFLFDPKQGSSIGPLFASLDP